MAIQVILQCEGYVLIWVVLHIGSRIHQFGWPPNINGMRGGPKPFAPKIATRHWPPTFPQTIPPNHCPKPGSHALLGSSLEPRWLTFYCTNASKKICALLGAHLGAHLGALLGTLLGALGGTFGGKLGGTWQAGLLGVDLICIYQHLMEPFFQIYHHLLQIH